MSNVPADLRFLKGYPASLFLELDPLVGDEGAAKGVALVFSSYFLDTPASAFGHTFLRFLTNPEFSNLYSEGNSQKLNAKEGGFVQLSFVEKQKDDDEKDLIYPKKVLEIIQNL